MVTIDRYVKFRYSDNSIGDGWRWERYSSHSRYVVTRLRYGGTKTGIMDDYGNLCSHDMPYIDDSQYYFDHPLNYYGK